MPYTQASKSQVLPVSCPLAFVHLVSAGALTLLWAFNKTQPGSFTVPMPGSSSSSGDVISIVNADGITFQASKETTVISLADDSDITPAASGSNATGYGKISLKPWAAPANLSPKTWANFQKSVADNKSSLFLISLATGITQQERVAVPQIDGWIRMLGKFDADLVFDNPDGIKAITLSFASYKDSTIDASDLTSASLYSPGVLWERGGLGDVSAVVAPTITNGEAADILLGKLVISPHTYS
jgi:hypothetical protein